LFSLASQGGSSGYYTQLSWSTTTNDALELISFNNTVIEARKVTTSIYRDPSAWYHVVATFDTTNPTASDRLRIYVNGQRITTFNTSVDPLLNYNGYINSAGYRTTIGTIDFTGLASSNFFDGYLTEVNFIDGQALTPASFGAIDSSTGVWAPRPYSGTYGTNGFYLKFGNTSSVAALGTDSSGNGNTWTVNNVSLTAGATYDSMIDVPVNYADGGNGRGNYAVLNPLAKNSIVTLSDGNLQFTGTSGGLGGAIATIAVSSGKWYWEIINTSSAESGGVGIAKLPLSSYSYDALGTYLYLSDGNKRLSPSTTSAYGQSYTNNDVIGVALNMDAGTIVFYKNNTSQGTAFSGLSGEFTAWIQDGSTLGTPISVANFGQRPFTYTPPAGFRALNTNNLPTPSIVNGANFMAATTYTGNAAARSLSNAVNSVSFQPDLVWIKSRTPGATSHALFDSTRGTGKYLSSDTTAAETTNANTLTAFNGDGFSLGTDTTIVNANANSYIAWQWRESITAGLDVVSYAGTGVNRTVAHNLGVAPAMIIVKRSQTGATSNWQVRHTSIAAANSIQLNLPNQAAAATTVWASTAPTSSVFTVGTSADVNASGISYVAYCFAEIAGFSKFGSYTGNGLPDGPFVFCGFRPRFLLIKRSDAGTQDWIIYDTSRNASNVVNLGIIPNLPSIEVTLSAIDVLSNGFKLKDSNITYNSSGATYIFAAFAEVPSKYALAR
jgi:hypothetical protein